MQFKSWVAVVIQRGFPVEKKESSSAVSFWSEQNWFYLNDCGRCRRCDH